MKILKFGGASVKDAAAIRNVGSILNLYKESEVVVVVSAMGKTTNALENVTETYYAQQDGVQEALDVVKQYHDGILKELFENNQHPIYAEVNNAFVEIEWLLEEEPTGSYDYLYDQIVSIGELLSSKILSAYLQTAGLQNVWVDARDCIATDNNYREGHVNWEWTEQNCQRAIDFQKKKTNCLITQGFVGVTSENFTTTLGREGSDYTAAIIAYCMNAESVTIWKDVPGVLNADPKWFSKTQKLPQLSYRDAIELSYYGATVIHPKTIQPIQQKGIPLMVKSFVNPEAEGTIISADFTEAGSIPCYIFKVNQVLISIGAKDLSFIVESHLSQLFQLFAAHKVKINLMQNAAISFSVCVDGDMKKIPALIEELRQSFQVKYNEDMELMTVRYYNQSILDELTADKVILLETKSRNTAQLVMKNK